MHHTGARRPGLELEIESIAAPFGYIFPLNHLSGKLGEFIKIGVAFL